MTTTKQSRAVHRCSCPCGCTLVLGKRAGEMTCTACLDGGHRLNKKPGGREFAFWLPMYSGWEFEEDDL